MDKWRSLLEKVKETLEILSQELREIDVDVEIDVDLQVRLRKREEELHLELQASDPVKEAILEAIHMVYGPIVEREVRET